MSPVAWEIMCDVSTRYNLTPDLIAGRCRAYRLVLARAEVAKLLRERDYTTSQIGRVLNRDHTTIVFYLGTGRKQVSQPRWHRPRVKHLHWIRPKVEEPSPKQSVAWRDRYLIPYAGADMTEYVWRERPAA
jgi:Bacterial dnaA protein helix-turn-helix